MASYRTCRFKGGHFLTPHAGTAEPFRVSPPEAVVYQVLITDEAVQRLDHIGFFLATEALVDEWFAWLREQGVPMRTEPRTHRDGARSFYCCGPDGTLVQIIFHPPVRDWEARRASVSSAS
ncbi:VOC family protein [Thiolapillus sp.]|uniref:VOC family protein n=1 Tax=Thiolapillus sp. TaxID=2017437 RepID=UPI002739E72A|nr:VOC family protein [Thiolapillus sp.]